MKRFAVIFFVLICTLLCSCSGKDKDAIVGKWVDNTTEQIIEYTYDGYYYEYINENFTSDKTKYKANGKKITYYIEGEPESEFSVEYTLKDDTLVIGGELEYRRLIISSDNE